MRKKKEEKSEEEKEQDKKYHRFIFICVIIPIPILIILITRCTNSYFYENGVNMNPDGIGNAEWFGFLGGYLGGCFTLFAFIGSTMHNEVNLNKTLEENQRQLKEQMEHSNRQKIYEKEIAELHLLKILLTEILPSFSPHFFNEMRFLVGPTNCGEEVQQLRVLQEKIDHKYTELITNSQKLRLNSNIYLFDCYTCVNSDNCKLGIASANFWRNFEEMSTGMYKTLDSLEKVVSQEIQGPINGKAFFRNLFEIEAEYTRIYNNVHIKLDINSYALFSELGLTYENKMMNNLKYTYILDSQKESDLMNS